MSSGGACWVLNLDAEYELEQGAGYTASQHIKALVNAQLRHLVGVLVRPQDILLTEENLPDYQESQALSGWPGRCWCPTPKAQRMLESVGARPAPGPPLEILQRVNARPFSLGVRAPLAEASFIKHASNSLDEVLSLVSQPAAEGWLARRTFGAAGRGRRKLGPRPLDSGDLAWIKASLRLGPVTIEPWVEVLQEFTRSGWVTQEGEVLIGPPCFQATTAEGAWTQTVEAQTGAVTAAEDALLQETVETTGHTLAAVGFTGAFGIDGYRHRTDGATGSLQVLNPLSEINARYTMDWVLGMGGRRPDLEDTIEALPVQESS